MVCLWKDERAVFIYNVENNLALYTCNYLTKLWELHVQIRAKCSVKLKDGKKKKVYATKYLPLQCSVLDNYCHYTFTCNSYDYIYKLVNQTFKYWHLTVVYPLFNLFSEWWSMSMSEIAKGFCDLLPESWSSITAILVSQIWLGFCGMTARHLNKPQPFFSQWIVCDFYI